MLSSAHLIFPVAISRGRGPVASLHGAPLCQLGTRLDDDKTIIDSLKQPRCKDVNSGLRVMLRHKVALYGGLKQDPTSSRVGFTAVMVV